jgi:hypothetical protein
MAKGMHLEQRGKKSDDPNKARQHAYLEVATALNQAVHKDDYRNDLDKREVSRMIDWALLERKGVVGRGGYMERQVVPRITRTLRRMWERPTKFDYDGTLGEWNTGRKEREVEKMRIENGGAPRGDAQAPLEVNEDDSTPGALRNFVVDILLTYSQLQSIRLPHQEETTGIKPILLHLTVVVPNGVALNKLFRRQFLSTCKTTTTQELLPTSP